MAKRNTFRKALKQIKSVEIDEKLNGLNEQPTNSSKGVYSLNPSGWHNSPKQPAKTFYPDAEGNWPDGFPANPGDKSYTRPAGWWDNDSDWTNVREFNLSVQDIGDDGKNTDGMIASNGYVLTPLPPNTRHFILGPLVDGWVYNHGYDAYTNIGYLQKDTRQFVLLGRIYGQWADGHHYTGGSPSVWDGVTEGGGGFVSYNENFTLEHAQWFRSQVLAGSFTKNVPYFYSGGVPQRSPDWPDWVPPWLEDLLDNMFGGTAGGCGTGGSADDEDYDSDAGFGDGGHGPDPGDEWVPPGDFQKGDQEDAGGPWPDNPDSPSNKDPYTPDTPRSKKRKKDEQTATDHGLSSGRAAEMSDSELRSFNNQMEKLDKDIKKYADEKKALDKEARDIAIGFGVDVALTLFGGAILKGAAVGIGAAVKGVRAANKARQISKVASTLQKGSKLSKAAATAKATTMVNRANNIKKSADASRKAAQAAQKAQKAAQATANKAKPGSMRSPYPKGYKGPQKTGPLTGRNIDGSRIKQIPKGQPGSSTSPYPKGYKGPQKTGPLTGKPIPKSTVPKSSPQSTSIKNGPLSKSQTPKKGPNGKFKESDLNIKGPNGKDTIAKNIKNPKTGKWERINKPGPKSSNAEWARWEKLEGNVSNKVWDHYKSTGVLKTSPIGKPLRAFNPFVKGGLTSGPTALAKKYGIPAAAIGGPLAYKATQASGLPKLVQQGIEKLINDKGVTKSIETITNDKTTSNTEKLSELDAAVKSIEKSSKIDSKEIESFKDKLIDAGKGALNDITSSLDGLVDGLTNNKAVKFIGNNRNGIVDGISTLTGVMDTLKNARTNNNIVNGQIKDGAEGSLSNPLKNSVSDTTAAGILKGIDIDAALKSDTLGMRIQNNVSASPGIIGGDGNIGAKGIHNNLPSGGRSFTGDYPAPYVNNNGDLVIPDTYAFRPHGFENQPIVKAWGAIAQGLQKFEIKSSVDAKGTGYFPFKGRENFNRKDAELNMATILDQSVGSFVRPFGVKIPGRKDPVVHFQTVIPKAQLNKLRSLKKESYVPSINLTESTRRQLREIKKPYEIIEEPVQKLKKYRPNFKGKFKAQNTPDVTASKQSDELVARGVAKGQAWRIKDKDWQRYETAERMNIIHDKVGHGQQAWDMIIDENRRKNGWKNREIQEHLNIIAAEKATKKDNPNYESPWGMVIHEQQTIDTDKDPAVKVKHPLVKDLAKRLKGQIDYKDKPARQGYPNDPPPKMVDGWHPKLGQKYKYDKLDPVSARAMPKQGNPVIDANIDKASNQPKIDGETEKTKPKVSPKFKMKEANVSDWRSEEKLK